MGMRGNSKTIVFAAACAAAAAAAIGGLGWALGSLAGALTPAAALLASLTLAFWGLGRRYRAAGRRAAPVRPRRQSREGRAPLDPHDWESLAERLLEQGRYALLLRPQIAERLAPEQCQRALAAMDEAMAVVPAGPVLMRQEDASAEASADAAHPGRLVQVGALYLDRYPVTNRQYREFVLAGGYEEMALWDPGILAAVLEFVDRSGHPGPRFWEDGDYPPEEDEHPVVGVCWYEAAAYARWAGKRLPSDPEWVKAASWPVTAEGGPPLQRKYPWGDLMQPHRANLWATGPRHTVPVTDFAAGMSVGGVYQLVGNVWEWTGTAYGAWHPPQSHLHVTGLMKSLRGGAFDTYFDNQASCNFQSGDLATARKHNIGFRCALGMRDLLPSAPVAADAEPEAAEEPTGHETSLALAGAGG